MRRILAIDVGEKRVGLAISDELGIIAQGFGTIDRQGAIQEIAGKIEQENIDQIVVGMPYLPSGGLGSQAEDVQKFIGELEKVAQVPVVTENEVLTSVEAENRLKQMGVKNIAKAEIDQMAAIIILESYLRGGSDATSGSK